MLPSCSSIGAVCGWCKIRASQSPACLNTASPHQQWPSRELGGVLKAPLQRSQEQGTPQSGTSRWPQLETACSPTLECLLKSLNNHSVCWKSWKLPSLPPFKHLPGTGRCFTKCKLHVSAKTEEHNSACWYFLPAIVRAVCRITKWVFPICISLGGVSAGEHNALGSWGKREDRTRTAALHHKPLARQELSFISGRISVTNHFLTADFQEGSTQNTSGRWTGVVKFLAADEDRGFSEILCSWRVLDLRRERRNALASLAFTGADLTSPHSPAGTGTSALR